MSIVAIAGQTFRLRVELESQAAAGTFQSSPTLAAGDVKLLVLPASPSGSETFANSTNAPTALNGPTAQVIIAAAETTAAGDGGEIIAVWADAAGAEWYSLAAHIQVKAAEIATQTNITTVATVTNLTNAPTTGDLTATMKASVTTAATAATPTAAAVTAGVLLAATQGAVEFVGQVKITANAANQGALHIRNSNASGLGVDVYSYIAAKLYGTYRGMQLQADANQALYMLTDTGAATMYIEGPTTGGKAISISSPSDGTPGANPAGIYIQTQGGHPGILFNFDAPAPAVKVIGSTQGNWNLDDLIAPSGIRAALGMAAADLDTQLGTIDNFLDTEVAAVKAVTDKVDTALVLDGAVYQFTANALELAPTGGGGSGLTAQQTRDAMMLAPTAGAPAAGSVDKHLDDILEDTGTTLPELIAAISQTVSSTTDATTVGSITRRRGDSWAISLTVGSITGYTSLWFTARGDRDAADTASVLQVKKNASGLSDGLLYVNAAVAATAGLGSITVSDAATGAIIVTIDEAVTDDLSPAEIYYDVQVLNGGNVTTLDLGTLTITADVTRAIL